MSTFSGLNIARLGLQAQQKSLTVTAHNIANANTPGYSRQRALLTPTNPMPYANGAGMLGSGVAVAEIARIRDRFLDTQIRQEAQTLAKWETRHSFLSQVEGVFMEPSETGFSNVLNTFYNSWQELSLNPESSSVRAALVENGNAFTNAARHTNEQLKSVRSQMAEQLTAKTEEINTLAEQLAGLNRQIVSLTAQRNSPADLLDRRDNLLKELTEIIEFDTVLNDNSSISIFIAGRALVDNSINFRVTTIAGALDGDWTLSPRPVWERDSQPLIMSNGQLAGLAETRDIQLRRYLENFSSMVWGITNSLNDLHTAGMDLYGTGGNAFFTGTSMETLQVNELIKNDSGLVAASLAAVPGLSQPAPGDGRNALLIARLRSAAISINPLEPDVRLRATLDPNGLTTFTNFHRDNIARLGVDTRESERLAENQASLIGMLRHRQDSIAGVSLDEEMAKMIQFQLAYQASARTITAFDEIYDTLINRMMR
ncbi:MAG: Flagellar hook-associated protein 1 [Syntrophomonadaceae bacterium]|nr:Flagellar hook-associated protein 1 [Bacillota bacterium]